MKNFDPQKDKKESSLKPTVSIQNKNKTKSAKTKQNTNNKTSQAAEYTDLATLIQMEKVGQDKKTCGETQSNATSITESKNFLKKTQAVSLNKSVTGIANKSRYLDGIDDTQCRIVFSNKPERTTMIVRPERTTMIVRLHPGERKNMSAVLQDKVRQQLLIKGDSRIT